MAPERLAAFVVRVAIYGLVAMGGALLLHAREPSNPLGAAFVVLFGGIGAVAAARAYTKGRTPPA